MVEKLKELESNFNCRKAKELKKVIKSLPDYHERFNYIILSQILSSNKRDEILNYIELIIKGDNNER